MTLLHIEIVYVSVIHCIIKWCILSLALVSTNNADPESRSSLFAKVPVYWYPEKNVLKSLNCLITYVSPHENDQAWIIRGNRGSRPPPPPPGKSQKYILIPKKSHSYQVSIQCWTNIGTPAKRHLNDVSLAGRCGPC